MIWAWALRLANSPYTWLAGVLAVGVLYVQLMHQRLDAAEARVAAANAQIVTLKAAIDRQHAEREALVAGLEAQNAALLKMRADAERMRADSLAAVERARKASQARRGSMDAKTVEELNQWLQAALR